MDTETRDNILKDLVRASNMLNGNNPIENCKFIDWEQRRYEVAKEIYLSTINREIDDFKGNYADFYPRVAKDAIEHADVLITELQKANNNQSSK